VEDGFNALTFISVAVFTASVVFFAVQRIWGAVRGGNKEQRPRKALVLRQPSPPAHKARAQREMVSPDCNLSFVVSEDFKLDSVDAGRAREPWRRLLCFVPDDCHIVNQLVRSGARFVGKAFTDPVPFTLIESGDGVFRNPEKVGTVTGGEYSGCAILVRASMADFALAVDTVGGARIAAACCGVIGFKPTYESVLHNGISLKSAALDTVSFMAKKSQYLSRIGKMMELPGSSSWRGEVIKIYLAKDLFDGWMQSDGKEMVYAVCKATMNWAGQDQVEEVDLAEFLSSHATGWEDFNNSDIYTALSEVASTIAAYELNIKLLKDCNATTPEPTEETERYHRALCVRHCVQEAFKQGIRESKLVVMPALMQPPPHRGVPEEQLKQFMAKTKRLHALATLVGCPQLVFPIHNKNDDLYSVSILSLNKTDRQLLAISERLIPLTHQKLEAELLSLRRSRSSLEEERMARKLSAAEAEGERWRAIGNERYRDSDYETAVVAYTEAIQQCPYKAVYYSNRAMAYLKLMQYEYAEDDCSKALALDECNAKVLLRRGTARKGMGMYIEAQEDFQKVLSIEPNNRQARNELRDLDTYFSQA